MRKCTDVAVIMLGFTFFSGNMLVGQKLAMGLTWRQFVVSILVGGFVLGLYGGLLSYIGSKTRCGMRELFVFAFGEKGSVFVSLLITATQIGWFGVGISMFAVPIADYLFPQNSYVTIILIACFGLIMVITTQKGMKSITVLSYIAVPVIALLGCYILYIAILGNCINPMQRFGIGNNMSTVRGVQMVIGSYISGSIITPNFTRDATKPTAVGIITFLAFSLGNGLMFFFGAFSYVLVGGADIFDLFLFYNLFFLGIIVLGLNIWSSCDNGLYSAGIELEHIFGFDYEKNTLIIGAVSTIASLMLYNHFQEFLIVLNKIIPPIGIVLVISYFTNTLVNVNSAKIRWGNVLAVVVGAVINSIEVGIPILNSSLITSIMCLVGNRFKHKETDLF